MRVTTVFPRVGSTVTLIRGDGINVITDPGMMQEPKMLIVALRAEGLSVEDITHVFLTHQHTDHTANLGLFPAARIVDAYGIYDGDLWGTVSGGVVNIGPGIQAIATAGHTNEDMTLFVDTEQGVYAITHAWWHSDMTPKVDPYAEAPQKLITSRKMILDKAHWIIPGHGGVFKNPDK